MYIFFFQLSDQLSFRFTALLNQTKLHAEYADQKQSEVTELMKIIDQLKIEAADRHKQITDLRSDTDSQETVIKEREHTIGNLKKEISNWQRDSEIKEQKIDSLETAVNSLKEIIEQDNTKIEMLAGDNKQLNLFIIKKEDQLADTKNKLNLATNSVTDLQFLLGDAGKTIDKKNAEMGQLKKQLEAFRNDKQNLLNIIQQLATIGNPAFNLNNIIDSMESNSKKFNTRPEIIPTTIEKTKPNNPKAKNKRRWLKYLILGLFFVTAERNVLIIRDYIV